MDNYINSITEIKDISEIIYIKDDFETKVKELIDEIQDLELTDPEIKDKVNLKISELESYLENQEKVIADFITKKALNEDINVAESAVISDEIEDEEFSEDIEENVDEEFETEDAEEETEEIIDEEFETEDTDEFSDDEIDEDASFINEVESNLDELIDSIMSISVEDEDVLEDEIDSLKDEFIENLENKIESVDESDEESDEEVISEDDEDAHIDEPFYDEDEDEVEDKEEDDEDEDVVNSAVTASEVFDTEEELVHTVIDNKKSDAIGLKETAQVSKTSFEEDLEEVIDSSEVKKVTKPFKGVEANKKKITTKRTKKA